MNILLHLLLDINFQNCTILGLYLLFFYTTYAEDKLGKCTLTEPCRLDSVCKSVEMVCTDLARKEYCQAMCSNTIYSGSDQNIQCIGEKNDGLTLRDYCKNRKVCNSFCQDKSPGIITKLRPEMLQNGNCRIFWSPSNTSRSDVHQYFVITREKEGEGRCLSTWRFKCSDCGGKILSASPNEKCELKEAREFSKMDSELNWVIELDSSVNVTVVACSKWGCGAPMSILIPKLVPTPWWIIYIIILLVEIVIVLVVVFCTIVWQKKKNKTICEHFNCCGRVPTPWWIIPISIVVGIILPVALVLIILWKCEIITMTNIRKQCNCCGSTPRNNRAVPPQREPLIIEAPPIDSAAPPGTSAAAETSFTLIEQGVGDSVNPRKANA